MPTNDTATSSLPAQLKDARMGYLAFVRLTERASNNTWKGLFRCKCGNEVERYLGSVKEPSPNYKCCGSADCKYKGIPDPDADHNYIKKRNEQKRIKDCLNYTKKVSVKNVARKPNKPKNIPDDECIGVRRRVKKSSITIRDMSEPVKLALCTAWR